MQSQAPRPPQAEDIACFIRDGLVRLDGAFSRETAAQARPILWQATGCEPRIELREGRLARGPDRNGGVLSGLLLSGGVLSRPARRAS